MRRERDLVVEGMNVLLMRPWLQSPGSLSHLHVVWDAGDCTRLAVFKASILHSVLLL